MKKWFKVAVAVAGMLTVSYAAYAQRPYVQEGDGRKVVGDKIQANEQGMIKLTVGRAVRTFRREEYDFAFTPKPQEVAALEQMLKNQQYEEITKRIGQVFERYKFLGWAGRLAYIRAEALSGMGKPEQALQILEASEPYVHLNKMQFRMAKASALLKTDQLEEAEQVLTELKKSESDDVAAYAFNTTGELLAKKGRQKEAVLEYLKTLLVIEPADDNAHAQNVAREQVVKLLKGMNDQRYKQFVKE